MENSFRKFVTANDKVNAIIDSSFLASTEKELYKQKWKQKQRIFDE